MSGAATIHLTPEGIQPIPADTTLQEAYDAAVAVPQITIDGTPNPLTIDASVAGNIFALRSVANTNLFNVSTTQIDIADVPVVMTNALSPAANNYVFADTFTTGGAFIGGVLNSTGTITYNNGTFIWALLAEQKTYLAAAALGFAAFTLFSALPTIQNSGNFDLVQALVLNVGVTHRRASAGTSTTVQTIGMSFSAQTAASVSGAIMTRSTGMTAVRVNPTFNTVAGSTVNMGTVVGLQCVAPAVAVFGTAAGVQNITAYYGVDWINSTFGGAAAVSSVIRSNQASGTNRRFLDHTGTAVSRMRGQLLFDSDLVGNTYGASLDYQVGWAAGNFYFEQQNTAPAGQFRKSSVTVGATAQRWLFTASTRAEFNFDCDRFSLGAQSGSNGNQVGAFVTPARTVTVGGDWSDFLLTQAGSLTVNALALGRVSAWVINPISYAASTGSVANADTLTVGGFPTSSPGVTITARHSLHVIGGRSTMRSVMSFPPIAPAALSAGNNNDWAGLLTGSANNGMRYWARISGAAAAILTGIDATAAQDGDTFELTNVGANTITVTNQDAASAAANRIDLGSWSGVLTVDDTVKIRYDSTSGFWRVTGSNIV